MRRDIRLATPFRITAALAISAGKRAPIYIGSGLVAVSTTIAGRAPKTTALEGLRSGFGRRLRRLHAVAAVLLVARQVAVLQELVVVVAVAVADPALRAAVRPVALAIFHVPVLAIHVCRRRRRAAPRRGPVRYRIFVQTRLHAVPGSVDRFIHTGDLVAVLQKDPAGVTATIA